MFKCEFCNGVLTTKSSLNQHIKSSKTCIKLRGLSIENDFN